MSRYFLDRIQLDQALQLQAQPVLEALAADDNLRSGFFRRFESDDPPPYEESTDEEGVDDAHPLPLHGGSAGSAAVHYGRNVYYTEAHLEEFRLSRYKANSKFHGVKGY
jgi:hypothetical protein